MNYIILNQEAKWIEHQLPIPKLSTALHLFTLPQENMCRRIYYFARGQQVMLDRDLANLYGVTTKRLNEQVKRNINRFPIRFRFQLTDLEKDKLVAICDRLSVLKHSTVNPFVFTEQGVAMLATVLHSEIAINVSIQIMDAFTAMRHFIASNAHIPTTRCDGTKSISNRGTPNL